MQIGEPGGFLDWLTEALDSVVRLGRGYQQSHTGRAAEDVFESVLPVVGQLIDHKGVGFLTVEPGGVEFDLSYLTRGVDASDFGLGVERLVADGTFAWALYQSGPVVVPSGRPREWLLLHVLATPAQVMGMFVAVLAQPTSFVPDVCQKLLSLVLASAASVLESNPRFTGQGKAAEVATGEVQSGPESPGRFSLRKRGRVLLVDLDPEEERALTLKLQRLRCEVSVSRSEGDEAPGPGEGDVDLVFLGSSVGQGLTGSGPLAERPARSGAKPAPCVALLDASSEPTWEALPKHADGVLTRPVRLEALEAMVDRWMPVTGEDGAAVPQTSPSVGAGAGVD